MSKVKLSIIIVHYKVKNELFECIKSIQKEQTKIPYEIIVVDNDERELIKGELKEKFPWVRYVKSPYNIGFGAGNNLGAKHAQGDLLFFLNPDTSVFPQAIDILASFLLKEKNIGIVAPLLVDNDNSIYSQQGSQELGVLQGIAALSFLNKLFPNNYISRKFFLAGWDKKNVKEVDVVPGTALMIKNEIFNKIGKFDERFFLYFEEFDICNRVKELGYKIYILPKAKVKHIWEASTKKAAFDVKKIFVQSRFYYFKKHYGLVSALIVEAFARFNKIHLLLGFILALATFLFLEHYRF